MHKTTELNYISMIIIMYRNTTTIDDNNNNDNNSSLKHQHKQYKSEETN